VSWLRLDDGFAGHLKVLELSEVQRWRWVELLLMCASHGKGGRVTPAMLRKVGVDRGRLLELELLDEDANGTLRVHDWEDYNPADNAAAARQKRYRMRRAGVDEAEVLRVVPPLEHRHERYVTRDVTEHVTRESKPLRARIPVPNYVQPVVGITSVAREERDDAGELEAGHPLDRLLDALALDPARMDYAYGLGARVAPEVVAGILEGLELHSNDPAGYALEALRQAAT